MGNRNDEDHRKADLLFCCRRALVARVILPGLANGQPWNKLWLGGLVLDCPVKMPLKGYCMYVRISPLLKILSVKGDPSFSKGGLPLASTTSCNMQPTNQRNRQQPAQPQRNHLTKKAI
jgi:hypothetical protein